MLKVISFGNLKNDWRDDYIRKINYLIPFEWREIPIKRLPASRPSELLAEEEKFLVAHKGSFVLLEMAGKLMNSDEFYTWCFKESERSLLVGPAFGFHPEFKKRAQGMISLSPLTFTHSLAQLILAESIYRSACILKNHPFVK